MNFKKLICLWFTILLVFPAPCWSQTPPPGLDKKPEEKDRLEDQAQFYLQRIGPQPSQLPISGQLPPQPKPQPIPTAEPDKILTTAPRQPEETSAAEKRAAEYGLAVKQFGYSFFYKPPETFLPVQAVPVGPDYTIGPGDSIKILIWGSVQGEYKLTVDRNGQIAVPKVGVVQVSGLTYKQLKEVMDREFARQYTNFQMNVTLDNLRTIQVFVVGQARFPGTYAVSSLSTLVSALFAAGGPSKSGSMRNIQVRRGNKVVAHFDMYDFLIRGDKSKDLRLQSEDVIFIPPIGPLAAIGSHRAEVLGLNLERRKADREAVFKAEREGLLTVPEREALLAKAQREGLAETQPAVGGPVKVPGIYELKNERTLTDLLNLAGGLSDTAFKGRVQVLRVKDGREMVLFEDDPEKVLKGRLPDVSLVHGDMAKIFPVAELVEKKVRVAGAVKNPGEFGIPDGMRIKDVLLYAGGLLMEANQDEAEITRVTITPQGPETTRLYISPRGALRASPRDNILLKPNDYLFIRSIPDWKLYILVKMEGEIKFPGNYAIKKGETLSSVLTRAGGFTDKAYTKGAFFTRDAVKKMQSEHLQQALDKLEVQIFSTAALKTQTSLEKEDVERQKVVATQQQQLMAKLRTIVPLGRVVIRIDDPERLRGTPDDLELQDGDSLLVPQIQQTVNVLGSVVNPTAVIYSPYTTVKDYLAQVGGPTRNADVKRIYVIKVNGSALGGNKGFLFGGLSSARLDPGDSIIVPEDLERIAWLKEIKDIANIIGQIALTAGVVLIGLK